MPVTNFYTVDGEIIGEKTAGSPRVDYLTDALGSVTATVNQSGQVVNTYRYKPFGALLAKTGTGADASFGWVGTQGYRPTQRKFSEHYMEARHYPDTLGRWPNVDPIGYLGGDFNLYLYVDNDPISELDASGLAKWPRFPRDPGKNCKSPCKRVFITCYRGDGKQAGDVAVYCKKTEPVPKGFKCSHCADMTAFCKCQGEELGEPAFRQGQIICINGHQFKVSDCGCGQHKKDKPHPDNWIDVWLDDCAPGSGYPNHWACACPGPCKGKHAGGPPKP